jgi:hypothetical protein
MPKLITCDNYYVRSNPKSGPIYLSINLQKLIIDTNVTNDASRELFNDPLFINIMSKLIQNPCLGSINLDKFYCIYDG